MQFRMNPDKLNSLNKQSMLNSMNTLSQENIDRARDMFHSLNPIPNPLMESDPLRISGTDKEFPVPYRELSLQLSPWAILALGIFSGIIAGLVVRQITK